MCLLDNCTQSFRALLKFKANINTWEIILVIVPKKVSNTGLSLDIVLTLEKLANHKYNEWTSSICKAIHKMQHFAYVTRHLTPILGTICTFKPVHEMIASLLGKRKPKKIVWGQTFPRHSWIWRVSNSLITSSFSSSFWRRLKLCRLLDL